MDPDWKDEDEMEVDEWVEEMEVDAELDEEMEVDQDLGEPMEVDG